MGPCTFNFFNRSEAGDYSGADMFYRKGADIRQPFKPLLSNIVKETLSLEPSIDDVALEDMLSKKIISLSFLQSAAAKKTRTRQAKC